MRRRLAVVTTTQAEFVSKQRIFFDAGRLAVWAQPARIRRYSHYMPKNSGFAPSTLAGAPEADEPARTPPTP